MMRKYLFLLLFCFIGAPLAGIAQEADDARAATGGAMTLEDIMRRQEGGEIDQEFRRDAVGSADAAAPTTGQLGTLGGSSDPELWRALRFGSADISSQVRGPGATLLVQDSGMAWLQFREGPLRVYGGYFLIGVLVLLGLFYLLRGRVRIEAGPAGVTIERFKFIERFAHWVLAGSFIVLGITGLVSLFGRMNLIPLFGKDAYATIAIGSKWVHNNVSWAFMLALILIFLMWVVHNIPRREDLNWLLKAGGLFSKHSHPPARKFNAGQKLIFWAVILLGGSISVSGLALLFPFQIEIFAPTFAKLNAFGISTLFGDPLPEVLTPHAEMQLAMLWHAIVSFVLMGIIFAHIYIGSVGMEGAYDAMGKGEVDLNWAKEHHSMWVDEVQASEAETPKDATPAE